MAAGCGWGCNQACLMEDSGHSAPRPPIFAYMQPGEAFMVVGHTLSTIYSSTTDVATYHGKIVLFTGDWTGTRECVPILLPSLITFGWKKCLVVDDKTKLGAWYADNPLEYGKLWDPTGQDGMRAELHVPRMIVSPCGRQGSIINSKGL